MAQSSFYYYNPEQHGQFSQQPSAIAPSHQLHQFQQQMYPSGLMMQQQIQQQPQNVSSDSHMYMSPSSYSMQSRPSPRPLYQKPLFMIQEEGQSLSLDTDCLVHDGYMYPSTPPLSTSGSAINSPPMSCGILPTPVNSSFSIENIEGVKEGCEGEVTTEILAGGDWTRCGSPPLTPGKFVWALISLSRKR
jgi:hypothetical protein